MFNRFIRIFLIVCFTLNLLACTNSASPTTSPATPDEAPVTSSNTSIPIKSTTTVETTATTVTTTEPTLTPTPKPLSAHWYWASNTEDIVFAVNQDGEVREIGNLPGYQKEFDAFPVDTERAILFTDEGAQLHAYMLTPDGIQTIELPYLPVTDDSSRSNWTVPAVYGKYLVFAYTTTSGSAGDNGTQADSGPLVLINLETLTAEIIDKHVNNDAYTGAFREIRSWAHLSEDGRSLRYLNGDKNSMSLRELDLSTGTARTIYTGIKPQKTSSILGSLTGDLWYFRGDRTLINIHGDQTQVPVETTTYHPLRGGKAMTYSYECEDRCEVKVVSPFNDKEELKYTIPWSTAITSHNPLMNLLTEDQSLIFTAVPLNRFVNTPSIVNDYPSFPQSDSPVFRLTLDGKARLIGFYTSETSSDIVPASTDGRYLFLKSVDGSSYFVYDTKKDHPVAEIPIDPNMKDYFGGSIYFRENGFIIKITASTPDGSYRDSYLMYSFQTEESFYWESDTEVFDYFQDILPDNTIICESADMNTSANRLIRYDPRTQKSETLLENAWNLITVR
ncbi:MAG: hypothetical protein IPP66_02725 [Anaerolineales bacterium]|nr:hypothetical protein [Anaerolineales bacterium]